MPTYQEVEAAAVPVSPDPTRVGDTTQEVPEDQWLLKSQDRRQLSNGFS